MRRQQVEALLQNAAPQGPDFHITVPYSEMPAVLTIMKHLELAGQFDSFSRRHAEAECEHCPNGACGCIDVYGYTG